MESCFSNIMVMLLRDTVVGTLSTNLNASFKIVTNIRLTNNNNITQRRCKVIEVMPHIMWFTLPIILCQSINYCQCAGILILH